MRGKHPQPSQDGVRSVGDSSCVGGEGMNNMQSYVVDELCYERGESYTTLGQSGPGAMSAGFAALHSPSRHLVEYTIILQLQCQALEGGRREPVNVPEKEGINRHTFRQMTGICSQKTSKYPFGGKNTDLLVICAEI